MSRGDGRALEEATEEYERIARALRQGGRGHVPSAEGITLWGGLTPELDGIAVDALLSLRSSSRGATDED